MSLIQVKKSSHDLDVQLRKSNHDLDVPNTTEEVKSEDELMVDALS